MSRPRITRTDATGPDATGPDATNPGVTNPGAPGRGTRGQPSAAERARTLVEGNSSAVLDIPGASAAGQGGVVPAARTVLPGGEVLLLVPEAAPATRLAACAWDTDLPCVLEVTDVAPVSVARRIRGRVWVSGWVAPGGDRAAFVGVPAQRQAAAEALTLVGAAAARRRPEWTVLRLEVGEVLVDDLWGVGTVEPEEFAAAAPDPLAATEAELLQHLAAAHPEELLGLRALLGERGGRGGRSRRDGGQGGRGSRDGEGGDGPSTGGHAGAGPRTAVPVALDRFGLRVRFGGTGTAAFDARFDFPEPAGCHAALRRAMHALFAAAHEAGA
jgi:hypothetical protein